MRRRAGGGGRGHRAALALALLCAACGSASVAPTPAAAPSSAEEPAPAEPGEEAATGCAEVQIGLDLRALPRNPTPGMIDHFVGAQAARFREQAASPPPIVEHAHGVGGLSARFGAPRDDEAIARCEQSVQAYLVTAPRLPVTMEPAAHVVAPCAPCSAAARATHPATTTPSPAPSHDEAASGERP